MAWAAKTSPGGLHACVSLARCRYNELHGTLMTCLVFMTMAKSVLIGKRKAQFIPQSTCSIVVGIGERGWGLSDRKYVFLIFSCCVLRTRLAEWSWLHEVVDSDELLFG